MRAARWLPIRLVRYHARRWSSAVRHVSRRRPVIRSYRAWPGARSSTAEQV